MLRIGRNATTAGLAPHLMGAAWWVGLELESKLRAPEDGEKLKVEELLGPQEAKGGQEVSLVLR